MESGVPGADVQAEHMLSLAAEQAPDDSVLIAALGYVEQRRNNIYRATELYQQALGLDSTLIDAATNLGVIEARNGRIATAVRLWQDVFARSPGMSGVGMNMVRAPGKGRTGRRARPPCP